MSDNNSQEIYWALVEEFIENANDKLEGNDLGLVCGAMLEASSRFAAFYVASSSEDRKALKDDAGEAVKRFSTEFNQRLAENLENYHENYKVLLKSDEL